MILQALKEYYDRKASDSDSKIEPRGWQRKAIPYLLVIDYDGKFVHFKETKEKNKAKDYIVPSLGEKKGNGIKANLFWENPEYMLGIPIVSEKRKPKINRVKEQHDAFKKRIFDLSGESKTLTAIKRFLQQFSISDLQKDPLWQEIYDANQPLLFAIAGVGPVTDDSEIKSLISSTTNISSSTQSGRCLVTGETDEIALLEPQISAIAGANPTGASLVGFQKNSGYDSYGKEQGGNAPISKTASFAYTTALNNLLKNNYQRIRVADATAVFWAEKNTRLEKEVIFFFSEPYKDDPDQNTEAVSSLYNSIWNGAYSIPDEDTKFYVLGLSPNSARISVRFWHVGTVKEIGKRLSTHIDDLKVVHPTKFNPALPMKVLLISTVPQSKSKSDNIPPNLAGDFMRCILEGLPYPETLLQAAIRRNRAEQSVTYPRAALIKACINRRTRYKNPNIKEELKMSLDKENKNIGYRLGRLFAVLVKNQEDANNASSIRDSYYGVASSAPAVAFGTLMRLSKHHLSKIEKEKPGLFVSREKLIGEIMDGITDFPAHLPIDDQGRFAIGYYHQTQDFYTKKEDKN